MLVGGEVLLPAYLAACDQKDKSAHTLVSDNRQCILDTGNETKKTCFSDRTAHKEVSLISQIHVCRVNV